jgi:hypothetical protein
VEDKYSDVVPSSSRVHIGSLPDREAERNINRTFLSIDVSFGNIRTNQEVCTPNINRKGW